MRLLREASDEQERREASAADHERARDHRQEAEGAAVGEEQPGGAHVRAGRQRGPQRVPVRGGARRGPRRAHHGLGGHGRTQSRIAHQIRLYYLCVFYC